MIFAVTQSKTCFLIKGIVMAASKHLSEMQNDLPKSENVKPVQKKHETLAFRALQMTRKEEKQRKKAKKDN